MTLFAAAPARAAIPHSEITLFSDFGHDLVDGSEWRWTSDDEELDAYVENDTDADGRGRPEVRRRGQALVHVRSAPRHDAGPGVYRVPKQEPLFAPRLAGDGTSPPRYRLAGPRLPVPLVRGVRDPRARCRAGREGARAPGCSSSSAATREAPGRVRGDPDRDAAYAAARHGARGRCAGPPTTPGTPPASVPVRVNATAPVVGDTASSAPTPPRSPSSPTDARAPGRAHAISGSSSVTAGAGHPSRLARGRRRVGSPHPRPPSGLFVRRRDQPEGGQRPRGLARSGPDLGLGARRRLLFRQRGAGSYLGGWVGARAWRF